LSGTGKTTLAARIASAIGRPPGAAHLRSDIERKRLFGAAELERLPETAYRAEVSDTVFATLRDEAATAIRTGHSVIVDAVHRSEEERDLIAAVAAAANVRFVGLWLEAPLDVLIERVKARMGDASDASVQVVVEQASRPAGAVKWTRLDAATPIDAMARAALVACRL
jgi:predicted kinase